MTSALHIILNLFNFSSFSHSCFFFCLDMDLFFNWDQTVQKDIIGEWQKYTGTQPESTGPWIIWSKWWIYLSCLWGPQGKNTEVVCHSLLQWTTFCQNSPPWCNHLGWPYTTNCGKFFKRWKYRTTLPASWEICMQVKKQQLEPNMEQWTGSKLERHTSRMYIVTLLI